MATKNYDPAQVLASFLGNILSGFADGTFIEVEYDEDTFTKKVGSDGEVTRTRNSNKGAKIKITLEQGSVSNDVLSALANADRLSGGGLGPFVVKDLSGSTALLAPEAWIMKSANVTFGKESGTREWTFDCAELEGLIGGNL